MDKETPGTAVATFAAGLNRQGPDVGTHRRPIVTDVTPASAFYRAEEYHQRYLAKRGMPGCHL